MSKSLDFCKNRASNNGLSRYADRNWDDAFELESAQYFDSILNGERNFYISGKDANETECKINVKLDINPDAEFSYFTSSSSLNDGTLLFMVEHIYTCIYNVLQLQTYDVRIPRPKDGDTVQYTVGNLVILREYDEDGTKFTPKDKPWMAERMTVLLPIKYSLIISRII